MSFVLDVTGWGWKVSLFALDSWPKTMTKSCELQPNIINLDSLSRGGEFSEADSPCF